MVQTSEPEAALVDVPACGWTTYDLQPNGEGAAAPSNPAGMPGPVTASRRRRDYGDGPGSRPTDTGRCPHRRCDGCPDTPLFAPVLRPPGLRAQRCQVRRGRRRLGTPSRFARSRLSHSS